MHYLLVCYPTQGEPYCLSGLLPLARAERRKQRLLAGGLEGRLEVEPLAEVHRGQGQEKVDYGPLCRHCGAKKPNRPLGLCWQCYYTPGVRALFPSLSSVWAGRRCGRCGLLTCRCAG